jgi:hypothetical protein
MKVTGRIKSIPVITNPYGVQESSLAIAFGLRSRPSYRVRAAIPSIIAGMIPGSAMA